MLVEPGFEALRRALSVRRGRASLRATLVGDLETPVAAFLKLRQGRDGAAFLLESVEGGAVRGRYSMIGLDPDLVWRCRDGRRRDQPQARAPGRPSRRRGAPAARKPAGAHRRERASPLDDDLPPMSAGLFGYLGYDMVRLMERLPEPNPDALDVPDAILIRPTVMVVFDAVRDEISLITPVRPQSGRLGEGRLRDARSRASSASCGRSSGPCPSTTGTTRARLDVEPPRLEHTPEPNSWRWSSARRNTSAPATSFRSCCRSASRRRFPLPRLRALPLAQARQPGAVPLLSRLRGLPDRLLVARDPGAGARRHGDHPPDRRHAAARRDRVGGSRASPTSSWPTRRSAPST